MKLKDQIIFLTVELFFVKFLYISKNFMKNLKSNPFICLLFFFHFSLFKIALFL